MRRVVEGIAVGEDGRARCWWCASDPLYVWRFEPEPRARPRVLDHAALMQITSTPESKAMSKDLRRRGWSFVGPTTVYSFMEAVGIVNDHLEGCAFRGPVERERRAFRRPL